MGLPELERLAVKRLSLVTHYFAPVIDFGPFLDVPTASSNPSTRVNTRSSGRIRPSSDRHEFGGSYTTPCRRLGLRVVAPQVYVAASDPNFLAQAQSKEQAGGALVPIVSVFPFILTLHHP